jgi:hypothetical protein
MKSETITEKVPFVADLISKYLLKELSQAESEQLKAWIKESLDNWVAFQELTDPDSLAEKLKIYFSENTKMLPQRVRKQSGKTTKWKKLSRWRYPAL